MAEPAPSRIALRESAYRYSDYDTPFWARPNTAPGRWHRARTEPTQYLSLSIEGAWAELIRAEGLRDEAEIATVSMPMWAAEIDQGLVADYATFEVAEAAGFAPDALVDEDWTRCQAEGDRLRTAGYAGVVAPSAALAGALNLTLFGPRYATRWEGPSGLAHAVPARVITRGAPPPGLAASVRMIGEPHGGLAAFRTG